MSERPTNPRHSSDEFLALLTDAAYRVALRHGLKGPFLEMELELWATLGELLKREAGPLNGSRLPEPTTETVDGPRAHPDRPLSHLVSCTQ